MKCPRIIKKINQTKCTIQDDKERNRTMHYIVDQNLVDYA